MNKTKLLNHTQAAKRLGIHPDTFRKWVKLGFPTVDVGKTRTKILERDVEEIVNTWQEKADLYGKIPYTRNNNTN